MGLTDRLSVKDGQSDFLGCQVTPRKKKLYMWPKKEGLSDTPAADHRKQTIHAERVYGLV